MPSNFGWNYHLQMTGAPYVPPGPQEFAVGDYIKVELDLDVFEMMQEGHGGWNPIMATVRAFASILLNINLHQPMMLYGVVSLSASCITFGVYIIK